MWFSRPYSPLIYLHISSHHASQATVWSPHRFLLWEMIVQIVHGFATTFSSSPPNVIARGGGGGQNTIAALIYHLYALTPICARTPICVPVRHVAQSVYQSLNRSLKSYVNGYRLIIMHACSIHRLGLGSQTRSFDSLSFSKALIINDRPSTELCIICTGQQRIQFIKYLII